MYLAFLITAIGLGKIYCSAENFDPTLHNNWKYLPNDICGQSNSLRIIGGKNASLGDYPWIARIGYSKNNSTKVYFRCGGVLINANTVLTASHCVENLAPGLRVSSIRLGEHYTLTDPDCEEGVCAEPHQDRKPSQIISHLNYNSPLYKNDIAIIRFKEDFSFNSYVKPICLLKGDMMTKDYTGSIGEVAGWGIYDNDKQLESDILLKIKMEIIDTERCAKVFRKYAEIGETQMCVGGVEGEDSCSGDSGGPLMKVDDAPPRYYLLGIVSFGTKKCGTKDMPGVYTRLTEYMPWVLDNLVTNTRDFKIV